MPRLRRPYAQRGGRPGAARPWACPTRFGSCHTAKVGGYVVEGHVPAADVQRLLKEKPKAVGIAVPSMPPGSPGHGKRQAGSLQHAAGQAGGRSQRLCPSLTFDTSQKEIPMKSTVHRHRPLTGLLHLPAACPRCRRPCRIMAPPSRCKAAFAQMIDGQVKKVDKAAGKAHLVPWPADQLNMPAMTMVFKRQECRPGWTR